MAELGPPAGGSECAVRDGHDVVRWTTKTDNQARQLYDRVGVVAPVVAYNASVAEDLPNGNPAPTFGSQPTGEFSETAC